MATRIQNRRFLFEQQLKPEFWDWTVKDKKMLESWEENKQEIFRLIFDKLRELVEEEEFVEFAIVVHDKDISYKDKLVEPHVHGYVDFPRRMDLSKVAKTLGVASERVETPKSKGGRHLTRINSLAYLIHAKDKDKYQYPIEDVETFETFDYRDFVNQNRRDFENYAATKERKGLQESLDLVLSKIYDGKLTYLDVMKDRDLYKLMARNRQKFLEGFDMFGERESVMRLEALRNGEYDLTILYIQGASSSGKSTLCTDIALEVKDALEDCGLRGDAYSASSANPFDNYAGEEILILEDLREFSISSTDWLKLFDPLNSARMSARYRNKLVVPRLVIMTAPMSPKQFFGEIEEEDINQYLRRINYVSEVAIKRGTEDRYYSISQVRRNTENGHYQRSNGTSVVLNFDYEDLLCSDDRGLFVSRILQDYIYPRILPKKRKDVTND